MQLPEGQEFQVLEAKKWKKTNKMRETERKIRTPKRRIQILKNRIQIPKC